MDDIFRSFFGFPNSRRWRRSPEDDENIVFSFGGMPLPGWTETDGHDEDGTNDIFNFHEMDDVFREFEEMFKSMGMIEFPPIRPNLPQIEAPDSELSPRDKMLKDPDVQIPSADHRDSSPPISVPNSIFADIGRKPQWGFRQADNRKDLDFDEEVWQKGIRSILPPADSDPVHTSREPQIHSQFHSQSVRIVRGADGKIEEHRTVIDGQGHKETTVTRRIGDQTHSLTTKEDSYGGQVKTENFTNIDQNELSEFKKRWSFPGGGSTLPQDSSSELLLPDKDQQTNSIFKRLFGFNLPGSGSI